MSEREGQNTALIVDATTPEPSRLWSMIGSVLLILLLLTALLLNPFYLWGLVLAMLFSVIGARLLGRIVPPRRHPLNAPLLPLYTVLVFFLGGSQPWLFGGLLLFLATLHAALWLIRTRDALNVATWGLLSISALAAPLAWSQLEPALGPEYRALIYPASYGELGLILLIALFGFFPWLLTLRPPHRISGYSLLVLLLAGLAAPMVYLSLYRLPGSFSTASLLQPETLVLILILLVVAGMTLRRVLVEHKRWREPEDLRGLLSGALPLSLLVVVLALLPEGASLRIWAWLGASMAVSLSAREIRVNMDPTRHPASRPAPFWAIFEEAWIVTRSLVATAVAAMQKKRFSKLNTPRRVLAPDGKLFIPYPEGEPHWAPVVMHIHSNRWEGAFTAKEVMNHYATLGAKSIILTDHNRTTRPRHRFAGPPAYEHGWGPHNHHAILLGARKTIPERHAFGGPFGSRIETLGRLREVGELIVLAHPGSSDAWPREEVTGLDYDFIELFNKSYDDTAPWDDALTSGLLVWGTAGDDNHDLRSRHQTGKRFMLLNVKPEELVDDEPLSPERVLELLSMGGFAACCLAEPPNQRRITRTLPEPDMPRITRFVHLDNGLEVEFSEAVETMRVIGPGGAVLEKLTDRRKATVVPPESASYARLELQHGFWRIALNPVVRVLGDAPLPWE